MGYVASRHSPGHALGVEVHRECCQPLDERYLHGFNVCPSLTPDACLGLLPKLLTPSEEMHMPRSVVSAMTKNTPIASYYPPLADIVVKAPTHLNRLSLLHWPRTSIQGLWQSLPIPLASSPSFLVRGRPRLRLLGLLLGSVVALLNIVSAGAQITIQRGREYVPLTRIVPELNLLALTFSTLL